MIDQNVAIDCFDAVLGVAGGWQADMLVDEAAAGTCCKALVALSHLLILEKLSAIFIQLLFNC